MSPPLRASARPEVSLVRGSSETSTAGVSAWAVGTDGARDKADDICLPDTTLLGVILSHLDWDGARSDTVLEGVCLTVSGIEASMLISDVALVDAPPCEDVSLIVTSTRGSCG